VTAKAVRILVALALTLAGVMVTASACSGCSTTASATACSNGGNNNAPPAGPVCDLNLFPLQVTAGVIIARLDTVTCNVPVASATVTLWIDYAAPGTNPNVGVQEGVRPVDGIPPLPAFNTTTECRTGTFTPVVSITGEGINENPIVQGAPYEGAPMTISSSSQCD
jgi:hypothetical protein